VSFFKNCADPGRLDRLNRGAGTDGTPLEHTNPRQWLGKDAGFSYAVDKIHIGRPVSEGNTEYNGPVAWISFRPMRRKTLWRKAANPVGGGWR
jgi:hypothetical protein